MKIQFYDSVDDNLLKFAVIISKSNGKWVFCKHKERDTYEIPGGHRENGEAIDVTAERELQEETGAIDFSIKPICVYSVTGKNRVNNTGEETYGMLYFADIKEFNKELNSEMEKIVILEKLPSEWTYPLIQPLLIKEYERRKRIFEEAKDKLFKRIGSAAEMVLATCNDNCVSARTVSVLNINGLLYFQTDINMPKAKEIAKNPNVALCLNEVSIKGICQNIGKPNIDKNSFFIERFREYFPSAFEKYSNLEDEAIIEITPILTKTWKYIDNRPYIEYIDFVKEEYRIEQYKL